MGRTQQRGDSILDGSIIEADLGLSDVTTGNADITKHGFMPKLPNDANKFLNGVGNWVTIAAMSKPIVQSNTFFPQDWTLVGGLYQAYITINGVTTNHAMYGSITAGEEYARSSGLLAYPSCGTNRVTIYALTPPTGNISIEMQIYDVGGFTKGGIFLPVNLASVAPVAHSPSAGATETLDLGVSLQHNISLPVGAVTLALSNATVGKKFIVTITQNASTGGTVTWFSTIRWASGIVPTITATASKRDTFAFICTGAGTYDGFIVGQGA